MEETRSAKKAATAVASPISHLANLSPDEFDEILKRLHINDRQRLACCCKSLDVAVATSFVWRDLSFGKSPLLVSSVAKWMSDASLARLLRKVGPQVERVSLEGCGKSLTGTGLSPLKGSRTLVQADVRCKGLDGPRVTLILQTMLAPECRLSSVLSFKGCKVHGKVVKVNSPSRGCLGPEFAVELQNAITARRQLQGLNAQLQPNCARCIGQGHADSAHRKCGTCSLVVHKECWKGGPFKTCPGAWNEETDDVKRCTKKRSCDTCIAAGLSCRVRCGDCGKRKVCKHLVEECPEYEEWYGGYGEEFTLLCSDCRRLFLLSLSE